MNYISRLHGLDHIPNLSTLPIFKHFIDVEVQQDCECLPCFPGALSILDHFHPPKMRMMHDGWSWSSSLFWFVTDRTKTCLAASSQLTFLWESQDLQDGETWTQVFDELDISVMLLWNLLSSPSKACLQISSKSQYTHLKMPQYAPCQWHRTMHTSRPRLCLKETSPSGYLIKKPP
jgi:hypothetical protein